MTRLDLDVWKFHARGGVYDAARNRLQLSSKRLVRLASEVAEGLHYHNMAAVATGDVPGLDDELCETRKNAIASTL
jgi:hypothetical protein